MTIPDWEHQYARILKEFGYDRYRDEGSAALLGTIIRESDAEARIARMIRGSTIFVIGGRTLAAVCSKASQEIRGRDGNNCS